MNALVIRNLQKKYSNGILAVKNLHLEVQEGDFFGLLGPNGAGKSTTIGIIASLVNKTQGEIQIFGHDIEKSPAQAKALLGLVPQEFNFNIFERVIDILTNQAGYYGIPLSIAQQRAEYYLKKLSLWDKAKQPARTLSGGLKRRLLIARGLMHDPKLLILDEPTAGVDIELRRATWEFLKEINSQGTTVILTTHYLEEAESLCKRVAIIHHGEIIEDTSVKQLLSKLDKESFILDLQQPLKQLPEIAGFTFILHDEVTLEAHCHKQTGLNKLFIGLAAQGVEVMSLRNKANRLEALFLDLVKEKQ